MERTINPPAANIIGTCEHCSEQVEDTDFHISGNDFLFCNEYCACAFITRHPRTIIDLLIEKGVFSK